MLDEINRDAVAMVRGYYLAVKALKLYDAWDAMPADRGGNDGPKGKACAAFIKAKDEALAAVEGTK